jgi:hypothetical protein
MEEDLELALQRLFGAESRRATPVYRFNITGCAGRKR